MSSPEKDASSATIRYFGDYLLLGEIASGGMGVVYSAQQVSLNRAVAVKLIRAGAMATEADLHRFRTEAEAAAKLDHPNIVPIYEIGTHEGQHFISMKLIEGESLAERMANEVRNAPGDSPSPGGEGRGEGERSSDFKFDIRHSALLIAKVARAVHHAHQRGVLHRDIKPGNILLDENGEPHLTDFGLAKLLERDTGQSLTGTILGTPDYMAPEQAAGQTRRLTAASDIYSLGAVLYALLTGRPPFHGESPAETLDWVRTREPQRPCSLNPLADADLETICLKCLEKDPARRYPTAQALAEDLERWQRGEPILARPVRPWERLGKWARRNPAISGLAATIVVGGLLAAIGGSWLWQRAETARPNASAREVTNAAFAPRTVKWETVTTPTVQARPNFAYRIESVAQVAVTLPAAPAMGDVMHLAGVGPGGWRIVQNFNQVIFTENIGAGAAGWVWTPCDSGDRQWYDVASSANGMKLAAVEFGYTNRGGWIYTSTNGGINWTQCGSKRSWTCVASSADGTKLVAAGGWNTKIYTSTDSGATWTSHEPRGSWTGVASSADGSKLVAVDNGTNTAGGHIYTSTDGGASWAARDSKRNWECVASSADGNKLVAAVGQVDIKGRFVFGHLYTSIDSGENWTARMTDQKRRWNSVASSTDGSKLVAVEDNGMTSPGGRIYISSDSGAAWIPHGPSSFWQGVTASADGSRLVALDSQPLDIGVSGPGRIYISTDSGLTWTPREPIKAFRRAASSADGNKLIVALSPFPGGDSIFSSGLTTVPGRAGSFSGAQGSELELQYVGHNQFRILSASGTLTVEGTTVKRPADPKVKARP